MYADAYGIFCGKYLKKCGKYPAAVREMCRHHDVEYTSDLVARVRRWVKRQPPARLGEIIPRCRRCDHDAALANNGFCVMCRAMKPGTHMKQVRSRAGWNGYRVSGYSNSRAFTYPGGWSQAVKVIKKAAKEAAAQEAAKEAVRSGRGWRTCPSDRCILNPTGLRCRRPSRRPSWRREPRD